MESSTRDDFVGKWEAYFPGAALPLAFFYSDDERFGEHLRPVKGWACLIGQLLPARRGRTVAFTAETIGCPGGVHRCGFPSEPNPDLAAFLSCGVPGRMEGLRLKRSPDLVRDEQSRQPECRAGGKFLVFRRWDKLEEDPEAVVFFDGPDVLSGLFALAGYRTGEAAVIVPSTSGCGAVVNWPLAEKVRRRPRAILGMFDISARPGIDAGSLSFAVPYATLCAMAADMDESTLTTPSWSPIAARIKSRS